MTGTLRNGERWKQPIFPYCEGTVQWLDADLWCFMSVPEPGINGWPVSIPTSGRDGKVLYSGAELLERLNRSGYMPASLLVAA